MKYKLRVSASFVERLQPPDIRSLSLPGRSTYMGGNLSFIVLLLISEFWGWVPQCPEVFLRSTPMEMAFPIFQSSGLPSVSSFGLDSATGPFRMLLTPCNAWNERRDKNHLDEWPQGSLVHPNALSPNLTGDIIQAIPLYMAVSTRLKSNNSRCSRGRCNSSSRFPRCCR